MLIEKYRLIAFYMSFMSIVMIMNNSIGFDIYWHATSYYYYDEFLNYSDEFFGQLITPRYLILSYIYEVSSRLGIPIAVIASLLVAVPIYYFYQNNSSRKITFVDIICGGVFLAISFFYSGLSLSLIWALTLIKTKRNFFYLGAFFHPGSVMIFFIISAYLGLRHFFQYVIYIFVFFVFIGVMNNVEFFYSSRSISEMLRYDIRLENLSVFALRVIEKKSNEIGFIGFIVSIMLISKMFFSDKVYAILNRSYDESYLYCSSLVVVLLITTLMVDKVTFLSSVFSGNVNDVIYISWFDWFNRDYNNEFYYVFSLRY